MYGNIRKKANKETFEKKYSETNAKTVKNMQIINDNFIFLNLKKTGAQIMFNTNWSIKNKIPKNLTMESGENITIVKAKNISMYKRYHTYRKT